METLECPNCSYENINLKPGNFPENAIIACGFCGEKFKVVYVPTVEIIGVPIRHKRR